MEGTWGQSVPPMKSSFNKTSTTTAPAEELLYSYGERIFIASCMLLFTICGTTGNSMVIIAVLLSRKLQTATNVFIVSLATADLLTNLSVFCSVVSLLGRDGWPLPNAEWLCVIGGFMLFTCGGTSLYSLAVIAFNRLILITQPFERYRIIFKPLHLGIMVALTWIVPFFVCLALPLAGIGGFGYDEQHSTCSDLDPHPQGETFHLAQTIIFFPLPLITIIVCYVQIFRHVRRHFEKKRRNEEMQEIKPAPFSGVSIGSVKCPTDKTHDTKSLEAACISNRKSSSPKKITKMEIDITKNLFIVVCIFLLFLTPYALALFIPGSDYFLLYGGIMVLANSTVNPVIYARRHPHFKVVLGCMIKRRCADIPEPSSLLKGFLKRYNKT